MGNFDSIKIKDLKRLQEDLDQLAGVSALKIINELIVEDIPVWIIFIFARSYGGVRELDKSKRNITQSLIDVDQLPDKSKIIVIDGIKCYSTEGSKIFKLTRSADTVIDGNIVLKVDGSTYDPFLQTRRKI